MARSLPEYSRTIASWIMVSSRCVDGLSTGRRPVSAMITTANATAASRLAGESKWEGAAMVPATMSVRSDEPTRTDSAKIASRMVGSTRATMVVSRLAPIPPKAVPVSSPASVSATVPSRSIATTAKRSLTPPTAATVETNGMTAARKTADARRIRGAATNTTLVPSGRVASLRSIFRRSLTGWPTPAPARPSMRART